MHSKEGNRPMRHALVAALVAAWTAGSGIATAHAADSLTIEPGVVVKFGSDAGLVVRDKLLVGDNVVLTARHDDSFGLPLPLDGEPGDWNGLRVERSAWESGSHLGRNLSLLKAGADGTALVLRGFDGTLDSLRIEGGGAGLKLDGSHLVLGGAGIVSNGPGIDVGAGSTLAVSGSSFTSQAQEALVNDPGNAPVVARNNWWGDTTGPQDAAGNPDGHGVIVGANVDYRPWLTRQPLLAPVLALVEPATTLATQTVQVRLGCVNATEYRLSELPTFAGVSFAPIVAQASYRFSDGDGTKPLYVQYRDAGGQTLTARLASDVVLDTLPPTLDITSPAPSSVIVAPVAIEASATDGSGIARVEFFLGATRLGQDTTAPYAQPLETAVIPDGDYVLAAVATDLAGRTTRVEFPITVARVALPPDTVAPTLASATLNGTPIATAAALSANGSVAVAASDRSGVSRVEFLLDGAPVGSDATADAGGIYRTTLSIAGIANGAHVLTVRPYDSLLNQADTDYPVQVQHLPPNAPTIKAPANGATLGTTQVTVSGTAGAGHHVRLAINGAAQEGDTVAASNGAFSLPAVLQAGANTITAIATDQYGDSPVATVTVDVDVTVPAAPSNLQATVFAGGKVHLAWSLSSDPKATGYAVYRAPVEFAAIGEAQLVKQLAVSANQYDDVPAIDGRYYYRVVTVNAQGTASLPTNQVAVTSDKTLPFAQRIAYTARGAYDAGTQTFGVGRIDVEVTLNEPLLGTPYLSVVPEGGLPMPVDLVKRDDTHYTGSMQFAAGSGQGLATALFSGRDMLGNRGTEVRDGGTVRFDTLGPALASIALDPAAPIRADASRDVTATFAFDEALPTGQAPTVEYRLSGAGRGNVPLGSLERLDATHFRAQFTLPADAGQAGVEQLSFASRAIDALGNASTTIKAANQFQVYQGELPALDVPLGLKAVAQPGGQVKLDWEAVDGAAAYQVFRQGPGDPALAPLARAAGATHVDTTPADGLYRYAVASVRGTNGQESLSTQSLPVEARSSRVAPGAPQNLELTLVPQGVVATWQPPLGSAPASYRLYRAASATITSVEGLTPIKSGIKGTQAIDATPSQSEHAYVVTAIDAAGNESALSGSVYLDFGLLPVRTLQVAVSGTDLPVLSWTANGQGANGYDVFVGEGEARVKLTPEPITATTLTDTGYTGGERHYTVEAVGDNDKRMARSLVLPNATAQVVAGTPIKRNVMNRLDVQVANLSSEAMTGTTLVVKAGARSFRSEPFSLAGNATRVVPVVVGGYPEFTDPTAVTLTIESAPHEGELVRIGRTSDANVVDSALVVGIETEDFVRGATGKVRLTVENTSEVEVELVTATGGGSQPSNELRLKLLDADGNLLSSTPYRQATGAGVVTLATGQTVARIAPGQRYVSAPFVMPVPGSSPDDVRLRLEVDKVHYAVGQPEEVAIPGRGSERSVSLGNTPYYGEVTSADPAVSHGEQKVIILGHALDRASGDPVANAPLRVAINQEGFERLVDVTTDTAGAFRYEFQPSLTDAGAYTVGAIHPDVSDRPAQAQFTINRVSVTPTTFTLEVPKNYSYRIDYRATTATGSSAHNVRVQALGALPRGVTVELPPPFDIDSKQSLAMPVKISGDNTAVDGSLQLVVLSDGTGTDPIATLTVNYKFKDAKPALFFSPSFAEAGLARGQSVVESVQVENKGFVAASDLTATLLDTDGNPAPAWISLASNPQLGTIAIGDKRSIDLNIAPTEAVAERVHQFKVHLAGPNLPATDVNDINVFVSVTQSGVGNVDFNASDIYTGTFKNGQKIQGLDGVRVYLQNEAVISETYELRTADGGNAFFQNIPAGSYKFKASAPNHQEATGRFVVKPGRTVVQPAFLEYTLVSVEWSVREITIEDRYEITLNATFETDVPAPVVMLQPTSINLPRMAPGEVFQGELVLTNYGLLRADHVALDLPTSDDYYQFEFLAQPPLALEAKQRVRLPYRVVKLREFGEPAPVQAALQSLTSSSKSGMASPASTGGGRVGASGSASGTAGCYVYQNRAHVRCDYTCANGVWSENCGSSANFFYADRTTCPTGGGGTGPIGGGFGGIGGGVGGGTSGSPNYSEVQGLPLCTKGDGECFQPENAQSGNKEGGQ